MRHLLLFLFSLLPTFLWADNISVEKAQELAITFFKEGHPQRSAFSSLRLLVTDEAVSARAVGEAPAYYVFGCTDSEGFVIVAGDDAVMPVLGYSFDSSFPQTDLPVNLKLWLQGISEEIAEKRRAPTYGSTQSNSLAQRWTTVRAGQAVVELETAKWDQAILTIGCARTLPARRPIPVALPPLLLLSCDIISGPRWVVALCRLTLRGLTRDILLHSL